MTDKLLLIPPVSAKQSKYEVQKNNLTGNR